MPPNEDFVIWENQQFASFLSCKNGALQVDINNEILADLENSINHMEETTIKSISINTVLLPH